jgi:hypothetical protein
MSTPNEFDSTPTLDIASSTGYRTLAPRRIGELLVKIGAMTLRQVDYVLRLQGDGDSRRFGEIAISLHYLRDDSIRRMVEYLEV